MTGGAVLSVAPVRGERNSQSRRVEDCHWRRSLDSGTRGTKASRGRTIGQDCLMI